MNELVKYSWNLLISAAEVLFNQGFYKDSISRSYYAMFSAIRALLATKKLDSAKHSGIGDYGDYKLSLLSPFLKILKSSALRPYPNSLQLIPYI